MRWLRLYDDTINDPKVIKLPEAMRWHWIALLCVASKNDGQLPHLDDVAIQLRVTAAKATEIIATLVKAGLIDKTETGFAPHNWTGRQYKSDVSNERVKRYRERKCNVTETVTVTPPETEADTETEKKDIAPSAVDLAFEEFWRDYPKRDGANPKEPAAKLFRAAVKSGTQAEVIIAGVRNCAAVEAKNVGTPYIPQAVKWLRDRRWKDYQTSNAQPTQTEIDWDAVLTTYKRIGVWSKYAGPDLDSPECRVPREMLEKYELFCWSDRDGGSDDIPIIPRPQSMQGNA